jgi:DNA gyrase subunit A
MYTEKEVLLPTSITQIMESAYIDYSMSVIISRALPDVRDGLKPVQRRILYAMLKEGLLHNRPFDKCAGVVGEVLKNFHPHGDGSVYDTLVRLAQTWVMRYPLIDPQGNFGSVDGDSAAAYRYTECRLKQVSEALLLDIYEDTVDFVPNYKESTTEPAVLPAALPNLLMNGSTGIAVGMATNIPPHNLGELIEVILALIDNPNLTIDQILNYLPGPDFPTGGSIVGREGIVQYMKTGRGIVRMRGTLQVEELKNGKEQLVITEIPYNVNRATLVTQIAHLVGEKILDEVSDLRDESDEKTRVVIELKRNESPRVVMNKLFKHTPLESSFGVILLALDKRRPKQMNIKEMLECYIDHRREVVYRRTQFLLKKAQDRAHLLEGYKIALDHLDDFVKIIRDSQNKEEAKVRLMAKYPLSDRQATAILELRLYQLTGLERDKIEAEYAELMKIIAEYQDILANEHRLLGVIKEELAVYREPFSSPRKTQIILGDKEFRMEDVIANQGCIITITHGGFIKRTEVSAYRSQKRGGKGVIGAGQHDEDFVEHLFTASTHDFILFVMNTGRIYVEKVYEIPEGSRIAKGRAISNVLEMQKDEKIAALICFKDFDASQAIVLATRHGIIKKTNLSEYANYRKGGIIGIRVDDGDVVIGAKMTRGEDEIVLVTHDGMSIRFPETDLRDQGRVTRGVIGIRLREGDFVQAMEVVDQTATLLIAGENGLGKRSDYSEYRIQARAGTGIIATKNTSKIVGALSVHNNDEIMLFTQSGQAVRSPVKDMRVIGRATQGVKLIHLAPGDKLVGICRIIDPQDESPGVTITAEEGALVEEVVVEESFMDGELPLGEGSNKA